ncbi:MAG: hypothetical protein Q9220_005898 [cf. Caloplaca sp. 1 TL-2023]
MCSDINCTVASISDEFFHLLEFYVHNDAPLTCRIPTHPLLSTAGSSVVESSGNTAEDHIPLIFALAGTLQYSHLHINTRMNVVLHTSPDLAKEEADVLAATAYSVPSLSRNSTKIVIGDPLALQLNVRWYTSPSLPPSTTRLSGLGGHVHFSTVVYCLLSAGGGVAASLAYFRGVELPRRMRRYGKDRVGGGVERGYAFPGGGGFGMNGDQLQDSNMNKISGSSLQPMAQQRVRYSPYPEYIHEGIQPGFKNIWRPQLLSDNTVRKMVRGSSIAEPTKVSTRPYERLDKGFVIDTITRNHSVNCQLLCPVSTGKKGRKRIDRVCLPVKSQEFEMRRIVRL